MRASTDTPPPLTEDTAAALCATLGDLAGEIHTLNGVTLRGCRYVPLRALGDGGAQRITTGPCEWTGHAIANTGTDPLTVTVYDAAGDAGDVMAVITLAAGASAHHFAPQGVAAAHGLTFTVTSSGAGALAGAVYVARS